MNKTKQIAKSTWITVALLNLERLRPNVVVELFFHLIANPIDSVSARLSYGGFWNSCYHDWIFSIKWPLILTQTQAETILFFIWPSPSRWGDTKNENKKKNKWTQWTLGFSNMICLFQAILVYFTKKNLTNRHIEEFLGKSYYYFEYWVHTIAN